MSNYIYSNNCNDCNQEMSGKDYFGVKDHLWLSCCLPKEMLCFNCFESRLNRKLIESDFKEEKNGIY